MRRILFSGQIKSRSGYGNHARSLASALIQIAKRKDDQIIFQNFGWGALADSALDDESSITSDEIEIKHILEKCESNPQEAYSIQPDIHIHLGLPNEFNTVGKYINIGITAGCETNRISLPWIQELNQKPIDMLIVPSTFNKETFVNSQYTFQKPFDPTTYGIKLQRPVEVLFEGINTQLYNNTPKGNSPYLDGIDTPFNFLFVGHWLNGEPSTFNDRKNIAKLIKCFLQAFYGNKNVSLILKTGVMNPSFLDRNEIEKRIIFIRKHFNLSEDKTPKIHVINGDLTDAEMAQLHSDERIKAFLFPTHGESWGIPLANSIVSDCPVLATAWSGHMDYMDKQYPNELIGYQMREIPPDVIWGDILVQGSQYAEANENDFIMKMLHIYNNYDEHKKHAVMWGEKVRKAFSQQKMEERFEYLIENIWRMKNINQTSSNKLSERDTLLRKYQLVEKK